MLAFLAQDADGHAFCYSNADLRKGEEADEIFQFIDFWKRKHKKLPRELVFDSRLTTQPNFVRLDDMQIDFITLRRRSKKLLREVGARLAHRRTGCAHAQVPNPARLRTCRHDLGQALPRVVD